MPPGFSFSDTQFRIATPLTPGAVAVIELIGEVDVALSQLVGDAAWPVGVCRLRPLTDIDTALVARISDSLVWLMPHGGPRIMQRLTQWLIGCGITPVVQPDPIAMYPEAASEIDALALAAICRAASPLAIDLLLDQHRRWTEHVDHPRESLDSIRVRSRALNRLLHPPLVVVVGRPNAGKSTLTNALLGRTGSITSNQAGTTRDYVLSQINLAGLVVNWCDTPGRHETSDHAERQAIALSSELIDRADCLICAVASGIDRPELPRSADLCIHLKADCGQPTDPAACDARVSAMTGAGLSELVQKIKATLIPPEILAHPGPWLFDARIVLA